MSGKRRKRSRVNRGASDGSGPIPLRPPDAPYAPIAALALVIGVGVALSGPKVSTRVTAAAAALAAGLVVYLLLRSMLRRVDAVPEGLRESGRLRRTRVIPWSGVAFAQVREVPLDQHRTAFDVRLGLSDGTTMRLPLNDAMEATQVLALLKRRTPSAIWIDEDEGAVTGRLPTEGLTRGAALDALRSSTRAARRAVLAYAVSAVAGLCAAVVVAVVPGLTGDQRAFMAIASLVLAAIAWSARPKARRSAARLESALARLTRSDA